MAKVAQQFGFAMQTLKSLLSFICLKTDYQFSFIETLHKFVTAKLSVCELGSSPVLIKLNWYCIRHANVQRTYQKLIVFLAYRHENIDIPGLALPLSGWVRHCRSLRFTYITYIQIYYKDYSIHNFIHDSHAPFISFRKKSFKDRIPTF